MSIPVENNCYITNATASSMAFYAMAFLNNQGYSAVQINKMREKFSLQNLENKKFTIEELKDCFSNQSAYFLNLYAYMNENDRFEKFAENLQQQNQFKSVFARYDDTAHLKRFYARKIYHKYLKCEQIRKDYVEEYKFERNTGVFSVDQKKEQHYYVMPEDYPVRLGMRLCTSCYNLGLTIPLEDLIKL